MALHQLRPGTLAGLDTLVGLDILAGQHRLDLTEVPSILPAPYPLLTREPRALAVIIQAVTIITPGTYLIILRVRVSLVRDRCVPAKMARAGNARTLAAAAASTAASAALWEPVASKPLEEALFARLQSRVAR
jgi:hypothetical protein